MRFPIVFTLILLAVAPAAFAQTHFCIAGDLDHLNETQVADCKAKMTNVRDAVKRHGAPRGWHFVVVCDEGGWTDYASFVARDTPPLDDATFHTDRGLHWTFVRGSLMDADNAEGADKLLAVALQDVITPKATPMPNPKRVSRQPGLSIAKIDLSQLP